MADEPATLIYSSEGLACDWYNLNYAGTRLDRTKVQSFTRTSFPEMTKPLPELLK